MKSLLETLKHDIKREINKVNEKIEALFKRADDADAKTRALEKRCCLLESKLTTSPLAKDLDAEERYRRRKHIIISGVAEHESGTVEEMRGEIRTVKLLKGSLASWELQILK